MDDWPHLKLCHTRILYSLNNAQGDSLTLCESTGASLQRTFQEEKAYTDIYSPHSSVLSHFRLHLSRNSTYNSNHDSSIGTRPVMPRSVLGKNLNKAALTSLVTVGQLWRPAELVLYSSFDESEALIRSMEDSMEPKGYILMQGNFSLRANIGFRWTCVKHCCSPAVSTCLDSQSQVFITVHVIQTTTVICSNKFK